MSIFNFPVKAHGKSCQCILLAKELKLSKPTKLNILTRGKRGHRYFSFMKNKILKGLVRTMVFNRTY